MISIVTILNNEEILNEWLIKSLSEQTVEYELILINNLHNKYKSAAIALNEGCKKAKGKYIMCVHQDVKLLDIAFLEKAEEMLDGLQTVGIAGVAGMIEGELPHIERRKNTIYHGFPTKTLWGKKITQPEEVQTLDECLLIIPTKVANLYSFDEETCDDWHLYGVDYCLSIKEAGFKVYVLPLPIYHRSKGDSVIPRNSFLKVGSKNPEYYRSLRKVLKKHSHAFRRVTTTCGDWFSRYPILLQRWFHYLEFRLL